MGKSKNRLSKAQRKEELRAAKSKKRQLVLSCAARDSVFSTPELLELIFTFSSQRQVLVVVQRVCKQWRDFIAQSPLLQKKLFFLPQRGNYEEEGCEAERSTTPNPLLRDAFQHFFFSCCYRNSTPPLDGYQRVAPAFYTSNLAGLPIANMKNGRKKHYAFTRAGASWRSMLVSQPPPMELVIVGERPRGEWGPRRVVARIAGPVRMGTLYDLAIYGALRTSASVAWGADPGRILGIVMHAWHSDYESSSPVSEISSRHNIVVHGGFPRRLWEQHKQVPCQKHDYWERSSILGEKRSHGWTWMYQCEEYDAEAIDRLIEEAVHRLIEEAETTV